MLRQWYQDGRGNRKQNKGKDTRKREAHGQKNGGADRTRTNLNNTLSREEGPSEKDHLADSPQALGMEGERNHGRERTCSISSL